MSTYGQSTNQVVSVDVVMRLVDIEHNTTNFRSSENEFKVLSRVAFATKVCDRLLSQCS